MILLDRPYISDFLIDTIGANRFPVLRTPYAEGFGLDAGLLLDDAAAVQHVQAATPARIYSTSENAIGWIARHLGFTGLPEQIALFKDKGQFRRLTQPMYPDFSFVETPLRELTTLSIERLPRPFVIKPAIGFFSMGVHKVADDSEWPQTVAAIETEMQSVRGLYPPEVLDATTFLIEACIEGDEYAFDAYADSQGRPVILSILKHIFSSAADVSDRVYSTSTQIVAENLARFERFLAGIIDLAGLRNFPMHVEVRVDAAGRVFPIEINPMRFGGWCTTPDLMYHAYGFNAYEHYFADRAPDWEHLLERPDGRLFSIIVLGNSTGLPAAQIAEFDYDQLLGDFEKPLDLRRIDYREYPVFGFLFAETSEAHLAEIEAILQSDLKKYVRVAR
jgi:hypothetical protein